MPLTLVALVLGIFAALFLLGDDPSRGGEPGRYLPSFSAVGEDRGEVYDAGCLVQFDQTRSGRCVFGSPRAKKTVVVFGDSRALHWTPALIPLAKRKGWRVVALLRANCTPALVNSKPACNQWRRNSLGRIARIKPSLVVLGTSTGGGVRVSANGKTLSRRKSDPLLQKGLRTTMDKLIDRGAKVTLMRDLPLAPFLPSVCVEENPRNPGRCAFKSSRPAWMAFDNRAARSIRRVQVIDPLPKVCPRGTCPATWKGILKFRDNAHLSATYAAALNGWLSRRLQRP
jgi:hypothetical protein